MNMDQKRELLTEENYERAKKKVMSLALIILVIGILIGGSLIVTGYIKSREVEKSNEQVRQDVEQANTARTAEQVQADIDAVNAQIDTIESEISVLSKEKDQIFTEDKVFSERYYAKETEIDNKQKELSKLREQLSNYETELWKIQSGYNDTSKEIEIARKSNHFSGYQFLYIIGVFVMGASCMISIAIFMFGKQREILAFQTQQVMPIAQEGMEKITPTVAKSAGTIAKEVSKGIKEGLDDDQE